MTQGLPTSTTTLYLQPSGEYLAASTGVVGEIAEVVPVTDLLCEFDLDQGGGETSSDLASLAQDILHILIEAVGSNPDDPERGFGAESSLSGTSANLAAKASTLDSQLRKDSRVDTSQTTLVQNADGSYTLNLRVVPVGSLVPLTPSFTYSPSTGLVLSS